MALGSLQANHSATAVFSTALIDSKRRVESAAPCTSCNVSALSGVPVVTYGAYKEDISSKLSGLHVGYNAEEETTVEK